MLLTKKFFGAPISALAPLMRLVVAFTISGAGLELSACTSPSFAGGAGAPMAKVGMIHSQSDWVNNDPQQYKDRACSSHTDPKHPGECIYRCIGMWMHYLNPSTDATADADGLASKYPCNSSVTDCTHSWVQGCDTSNTIGIEGWISNSDVIPQAHVYLDWVGALASDTYASLSAIKASTTRPVTVPPSFRLPIMATPPGQHVASVVPAVISDLGPQPIIMMVNGDDPANPSTRLFADPKDPTKFAPWSHSVLVTGIQLDKSNKAIRIEIVDPDNNPLVATSDRPGYGGLTDEPGVYYSIDIPNSTNAEYAAGGQAPQGSVEAVWDAWTSVPGWEAKVSQSDPNFDSYAAAGVGAFISVNVAEPDPVLSSAAFAINFVGDTYEFFAR